LYQWTESDVVHAVYTVLAVSITGVSILGTLQSFNHSKELQL